MEAAKAVLNYILKNQLDKNAEKMGNYMKKRFKELAEKYPVIGDIRGLGLMIGIELVKDEKKTPAKEIRNKLIQRAFKNGLLLLGAGPNNVRLAPPLVITEQQIDMGMEIFEKSLKQVLT